MGYGEVGKRLFEMKDGTAGIDKSSKNEYWSWIEDYGGEGFQEAVRTGIG
jgi:hydroxymethylpyrimidine/phosphomethylpyrimidine kinase